MDYMINGSKITVTRKEDEKGLSILEGLINSFILKQHESKGAKKNDRPRENEKK